MSEFNELWRLYELLIDFRTMLGGSEEIGRVRGDVENWADTSSARSLISRSYADKVVELHGVPWLYANHYGGEVRAIKDSLDKLSHNFTRHSVEDAIREYVAQRERLILKRIRTSCGNSVKSNSRLVLQGGIRVNRGMVGSMDSDVTWGLTQVERLTYIVAAGKLPSETDRYHELGYVSQEHSTTNFFPSSKGLCADVSYTQFFDSIVIDSKYGGSRRRDVTLEFKDSEVLKAVLDVIRSDTAYNVVRDSLPEGDTSALDALFNVVPVAPQITERRLRL